MADAAWLLDRPIAHRGYHDMNVSVFENSPSAFRRAVDAGFAIECDLQYAADGAPVVFHDYDLQRLCGLKGDARAKTSSELSFMSIGGTADRIPSLTKMLEIVDGAVPIVLELKGREGDDEGFAGSVLEALEDYSGKVALMSFDHWLLADLKELDPAWPVGLTAEGIRQEHFARHREAMKLGLDFVSYCVHHLPNEFVAQTRGAGLPVITWTVRDAATRELTRQHADQMTFEGFDPREIAGEDAV